VTKVGNLGRVFELGYSNTGWAWASAGLAVSRPVVPGDWKGEKITEWYEVVVFGTLAENAAASLAKGMRVVVTGRGELETFIKDDGETRITKKILAEAIGPDLRYVTATVINPDRKATPAAEGASGWEEIPF
jgi:single-strand DNA-binding protein